MADKRLRLMRISFNDYVAYPLDFLINILTYPLYMAVTYFIWKAILENTTIAGVTLGSIFTYYVLAYAVSFTGQSSVGRKLSGDILSGHVAVTLTKPITYFSYTFWKNVCRTLVQSVAYFSIALLTSFFFALSTTSDPVMIVLFIISLVFSFLLSYMIYFFIGTSAFWMENNWGFLQAVQNLVAFFSGTLIPLNLLPGVAKDLAFLLPFRFTAYFPVSIIQGNISAYDAVLNLGLVLVWIGIFYWLGKESWKAGEKKLSGYGV